MELTKPSAAAGSIRARALTFLVGAVAFGIAHTQAPLYYSNQNQYFLHGLADGGLGLLHEDWLANTRDPTPIFSALVAFTQRYLHPAFFYVAYLVVLGLYFAALVELYGVVAGGRGSSAACAVFLAALVAIHSGLLRLLSARLLGVDYPWYFQAGLAGQYVLGPSLQPSTFGVLLLVSVALFATHRPWSAVCCACGAAILHVTYLMSAGILTITYFYVLIRQNRRKEAAGLAMLAAVLVAPSVVYNAVVFGPTSATAFAAAQDLLVHFRIPHHCLIERWLDWIACLQIVWIGLATYLARGTRLLPILAIPSVLGLLLTGVQWATGNDALALLFPWRVSIFLVPIATAVVLARVALVADHFLARWPVVVPSAAGAVIAGLVIGGVVIQYSHLAYQMGDEELAMMDFICEHKAPGDVYLVPVDVPGPPAKRGMSASDFKPLAARRGSGGLIPIELQRFRLFTGAPIFVDFKAIPYRDTELLEWQCRLQLDLQLYQCTGPRFGAALRDLLAHEHVTHVVARAGHDMGGAGLDAVYADEHYKVYRIVAVASRERQRPEEDSSGR